MVYSTVNIDTNAMHFCVTTTRQHLDRGHMGMYRGVITKLTQYSLPDSNPEGIQALFSCQGLNKFFFAG